jgi:hypothetical protein
MKIQEHPRKSAGSNDVRTMGLDFTPGKRIQRGGCLEPLPIIPLTGRGDADLNASFPGRGFGT